MMGGLNNPEQQRAIASQAEAEAGTLNTVDMSPLRVSQAIAALGGWAETESLLINIALNSFRISVNGGLTLQNMADGVVDEYEDQTGIDDQNCSAVAYNSTSDCYLTGSSYLMAGGSGDRSASITATTDIAITSGTISNLVDGGLTADTTNAVGWTYTATITGKYIRFDFGAGNAKVITEATMKAVTPESGTLGFWKWQGSNDAAAWTDVSTSQQLAFSTSNVFALTGNVTAYRYYQMIGVSGGIDSAGGIATGWVEMEFKILSGTTGVLLSESSTALTSPSLALIVIWEEDVDAITLNTDLLAYVSREAGQTFTTDFATDNKLDCAAHGFLNDERVMVTSSSQDLPAGLSSAEMYYVVNKTTDDIELSLTSGGAAVTITDNGTGTHTIRRWVQATLSQSATVAVGQVLSGTATLTAQTAGSAMRYALFAKNSKSLNIHGTALQWS